MEGGGVGTRWRFSTLYPRRPPKAPGRHLTALEAQEPELRGALRACRWRCGCGRGRGDHQVFRACLVQVGKLHQGLVSSLLPDYHYWWAVGENGRGRVWGICVMGGAIQLPLVPEIAARMSHIVAAAAAAAAVAADTEESLPVGKGVGPGTLMHFAGYFGW